MGRGSRTAVAGEGDFTGYPPDAFRFLAGLAAHNEKPWFEANRALYETAIKAPTAALITAVSEALRARSLPLEGAVKRSPFRIHRDVRFSKDKSPYKTNVGTVWYRQGAALAGNKAGAGILYFHLSPAGCFAAVAFYMPEADALDAIRERIRVHPGRFHVAHKALRDKGLALDATETLVRMPKGFEDLAHTPEAPLLKLKHFIARRPISQACVQTPALVQSITDLAADALPLLEFGWAAIDEAQG